MGDRFGWRGKVGLILPSVQTVTEPLFYRIAPQGVAFYTSRVLIRGNVMSDHADMEREAFRAAKELATAGVDCIAYCCTGSGILLGMEGDRTFCLKMEKETGIPILSSLSAMIEGLETMGLKKLVLISPYRDEMHHAEENFFRDNGFEIVKSQSMRIESGSKYGLVPPEEIYRFCHQHWDERAEGLFISCMNFNAMPCIDPLERDLGKPVLSSHSATLWKILKMIHVGEAVPGFGNLLAKGR
ncbi:MAG: hypothetical protein A2162_06520 [Deltaproteobacteria bacterium RBG_13_52_11b]|nr:MAG: hypothetical protein A2162_06520 [Deltaproteobacteria bacterium RBG_13_52_11b]